MAKTITLWGSEMHQTFDTAIAMLDASIKVAAANEATAKTDTAQTGTQWAQEAESKPFSIIRQGTATNALTKLRAIVGKGTEIDAITGTATITNGDFTISIPHYRELSDLKTSTYQLLDAITLKFTATGAKSPRVVLPLAEYMERRQLKDRKEAKAQVIEDIKLLREISISFEEKRGKHTKSYSFFNLADSGEVMRNGDIIFTFGATFYRMLLSYNIMPYPAQLQTLNAKYNPNSYYLLRKIAEHKNMNVGKKNEDVIAVKTLLANAPYLPTYAEVMATGKQVDQRIIKPFERDLNALKDTLSWEYCHSLERPLSDEELSVPDYSTFETLLIHITWKHYPDQTARLERKAQAIEEAKAASKKKSAGGHKKTENT